MHNSLNSGQIGNHDVPRIASRMGSNYVDLFNILALLLPGTPITYQGEELGMQNIYVPFDHAQDYLGKSFGQVWNKVYHVLYIQLPQYKYKANLTGQCFLFLNCLLLQCSMLYETYSVEGYDYEKKSTCTF